MRFLLILSVLFSTVLFNCKKEEGEIPRLAKEGKYYEAHHLLSKAGAEEKDKIFEETMIKIEAEYKKQQDDKVFNDEQTNKLCLICWLPSNKNETSWF